MINPRLRASMVVLNKKESTTEEEQICLFQKQSSNNKKTEREKNRKLIKMVKLTSRDCPSIGTRHQQHVFFDLIELGQILFKKE
ncbi:MAG: hypothetical protein Q8P67_10785 [archaeon]|nr:hypothetical protein [archaeon]